MQPHDRSHMRTCCAMLVKVVAGPGATICCCCAGAFACWAAAHTARRNRPSTAPTVRPIPVQNILGMSAMRKHVACSVRYSCSQGSQHYRQNARSNVNTSKEHLLADYPLVLGCLGFAAMIHNLVCLQIVEDQQQISSALSTVSCGPQPYYFYRI